MEIPEEFKGDNTVAVWLKPDGEYFVSINPNVGRSSAYDNDERLKNHERLGIKKIVEFPNASEELYILVDETVMAEGKDLDTSKLRLDNLLEDL